MAKVLTRHSILREYLQQDCSAQEQQHPHPDVTIPFLFQHRTGRSNRSMFQLCSGQILFLQNFPVYTGFCIDIFPTLLSSQAFDDSNFSPLVFIVYLGQVTNQVRARGLPRRDITGNSGTGCRFRMSAVTDAHLSWECL